MDVLFLGTSAALPSKKRTTSCIAIREGADMILLDCGEGSQRQLMISPFSYMKVKAILITHMHGDHVFGIPALVQTMGLSNRKDPLYIFGPKGIAGFIETNLQYTRGETEYPLVIEEIEAGDCFTVGNLSIESFPTDHKMESMGFAVTGPEKPGKLDRAKALGLGISEGPEMKMLKNGESVRDVRPEDVISSPLPGLKVVYTGDTAPSDETVRISAGADVLIHEATYMSAETANAREHHHSTTTDAAEIAKRAGVRKLILTHISHRYDERCELENEARITFPETDVADDLIMFEIDRKKIVCKDVRPA